MRKFLRHTLKKAILFIIALVIFSVIKLINRLKRPPAPAPVAEPPTPEDILLLRDIRDSLRRQGGHGTGS